MPETASQQSHSTSSEKRKARESLSADNRLKTLLLLLLQVTCGRDSFAADYPRLMINHKGPVSRVHSMIFTENPRRLYVAGEDKSVDVFFVHGEAGQQPIVTHAQTLHWPVSRGSNGHIYSMSLHPEKSLLAVAGHSALLPRSRIHLIDTNSGNFKSVIPFDLRRNPSTGIYKNIHHARVGCLSFAISGTTLFSSDTYGEIRAWPAATISPRINESTIVRAAFQPPSGMAYRPNRYPIVALSDSLVINAEPADWAKAKEVDAPWTVYRRSSRRSWQPEPLITRAGRVHSIVTDANRQWMAVTFAAQIDTPSNQSSNTSRICIRSLTGNSAATDEVTIADLREPRVTFLGEDRLLITGGLNSADENKNGSSIARVYQRSSSTAAGRFSQTAEFTESSTRLTQQRFISPDVIAASSDGRLYAAYSRSGGLRVYSVDEGQIHSNCTVIKPSTREFRRAWFDDSGDYIAFDSENGVSPADSTSAVFWDIKNARVRTGSRMRRREWIEDTSENDEFRFRESQTSGARVHQIIHTESGSSWALPQRGNRLATCFISASDRQQPTLLAFASDNSPEIFVCRLMKSGQASIVRCFRGHNDFVTSLTASPDGQTLVSTSFDHTVRLWDLSGLEAEPADDRMIVEQRMGATLDRNSSGGLQINDVHPFGILAARGVATGTVLQRVALPSGLSSSRQTIATDASTMLRGLASNTVFDSELTFETQKRQRLRMVLGWEPLATFCATEDGDWTCVSPRGYSSSSGRRGADIITWQQFVQKDGPLRFGRGSELPDFESRKILSGIMTRKTTADVQTLCSQRSGSRLKLAFDDQTTISLTQPSTGRIYPASVFVPVETLVNLPDTVKPEHLMATAWVNGDLCQHAIPVSTESGWRFRWTAKPSALTNRLRINFKSTADSPLPISKTVSAAFASESQPPGTLIHLLAIGVKDYEAGSICPPLEYSCDDARAMQKVVDGLSPSFERGERILLTDENDELHRSDIVAAIDSLKKSIARISKLRPNVTQTAIVFLCGHGTTWNDSGYFFLPTDVKTSDEVATKGVPWKEFSQLAELNCRKLFIIDTCDSGKVAGDVASESILNAAEQIREQQVIVISGTARDGGDAYQLDQFGHGALTQCFIQALDEGLADGASVSESRDGIVTLREVAEYVRNTLPQLTSDYVYEEQQATIAPSELLEVQSIPLKRL